jgi:hypothetical protein
VWKIRAVIIGVFLPLEENSSVAVEFISRASLDSAEKMQKMRLVWPGLVFAFVD